MTDVLWKPKEVELVLKDTCNTPHPHSPETPLKRFSKGALVLTHQVQVYP